ncbi:MAG: hypothetical protein Q8S19_02080 [Bacillota bacterium]|nr:hypothetical protein [Bacillota bacterium]
MELKNFGTWQEEMEYVIQDATPWVKQSIRVLVNTGEDYAGVMQYAFNQHPFSAFATYRKDKLAQQHTSYESFEDAFTSNKARALTELFLHYIDSSELRLADDLIPNKVSLRQLYDNHRHSPQLHMIRCLRQGVA